MITPVLPHPAENTSEKVTTGLGSHPEEAVADPVPAGDVSPPHSTEVFAGQVISSVCPPIIGLKLIQKSNNIPSSKRRMSSTNKVHGPEMDSPPNVLENVPP